MVGLGGTAPYSFIWQENPREHGGNARTGAWITHVIGPSYSSSVQVASSFAATDLNGDGRMDVVTASSEGADPAPAYPLYWWEAPTDRRNGTWIQHVIDPAYAAVHNLRAADMNGDGNIDILGVEQEQAPDRRITIFYGDGHGNFTQQILSNGSGHSEVVGDVTPDGDLDILNAGHGYTGALHPIELYLNRRKP